MGPEVDRTCRCTTSISGTALGCCAMKKGSNTREREAMEVAAGIGRDRFPQGDRSITVEVRDEQGQRVTAVAVTLHVDRRPSLNGSARTRGK